MIIVQPYPLAYNSYAVPSMSNPYAQNATIQHPIGYHEPMPKAFINDPSSSQESINKSKWLQKTESFIIKCHNCNENIPTKVSCQVGPKILLWWGKLFHSLLFWYNLL